VAAGGSGGAGRGGRSAGPILGRAGGGASARPSRPVGTAGSRWAAGRGRGGRGLATRGLRRASRDAQEPPDRPPPRRSPAGSRAGAGPVAALWRWGRAVDGVHVRTRAGPDADIQERRPLKPVRRRQGGAAAPRASARGSARRLVPCGCGSGGGVRCGVRRDRRARCGGTFTEEAPNNLGRRPAWSRDGAGPRAALCRSEGGRWRPCPGAERAGRLRRGNAGARGRRGVDNVSCRGDGAGPPRLPRGGRSRGGPGLRRRAQ
jgi:hypothetical protein